MGSCDFNVAGNEYVMAGNLKDGTAFIVEYTGNGKEINVAVPGATIDNPVVSCWIEPKEVNPWTMKQ